MKHPCTQSSGYILVLTLLLLSALSIVVMQMGWQTTTMNIRNTVATDMEKAKHLALNGLSIAYAQLSVIETEAPKEKQSKEKAAEEKETPKEVSSDRTTIWMKAILPMLNRPQIFPLSAERDGIDATIIVCMTSEQGKIPLNALYNFKDKKFMGQNDKSTGVMTVVQDFFNALKPFVRNKDLFPAFEKYVQKRALPFNDVTELLEIPELAQAFGSHIFYEPSLTKEPHKELFLTDLFTITSNDAGYNPLVLSDSTLGLFKLERAHSEQIPDRIKHFSDIFTRDGAKTATGSLEEIWNKLLKKPYGKEFKEVSKTLQKVSQAIPLTSFGVYVSATVNEISQKIFAIIEKIEQTQKEPNSSQEQFIIKRLYWL